MPEDGDRPLVFWLFARGLQRFPVLFRLSLPGLTWLDPAIHPFRKKMDARVPQTSLRSLRKLDCVPAHDGGIIFYHTAVFACGDGTGIRAI